MGIVDFPTWVAIGSYGGLACSLLSAIALVLFALGRRRGTSRQLAHATLVCLFSSTLMYVPIWWMQNRVSLYGPTLAKAEVVGLLALDPLFGWCVPLGALLSYILLAAPQATLSADASSVRLRLPSAVTLAALNDPARNTDPLGKGRAWGQLVPLQKADEGRPLPLTHHLTLLGREFTNDVVVDDERTSRYHAEIHWDHGHPHLLDRESMNGTFLNSQQVRGIVPLSAGDILELGAQKFRFELLVAPAEPAEPAEAPQTSKEIETEKIPGLHWPVTEDAPPLALVALNSDLAGKRWELRQPLTTIGRDITSTIQLSDPSVSRLHAQIVRQRSGYFVSDVQSSNGTLLNGQRLLAPYPVQPGDMLHIGKFVLGVELALVTPPASAAPEASIGLPTMAAAYGPKPSAVINNQQAEEQRPQAASTREPVSSQGTQQATRDQSQVRP